MHAGLPYAQGCCTARKAGSCTTWSMWTYDTTGDSRLSACMGPQQKPHGTGITDDPPMQSRVTRSIPCQDHLSHALDRHLAWIYQQRQTTKCCHVAIYIYVYVIFIYIYTKATMHPSPSTGQRPADNSKHKTNSKGLNPSNLTNSWIMNACGTCND